MLKKRVCASLQKASNGGCPTGFMLRLRGMSIWRGDDRSRLDAYPKAARLSDPSNQFQNDEDRSIY